MRTALLALAITVAAGAPTTHAAGPSHSEQQSAHGDHGGDHGSIDWFELGSMFVNFALLFGFLAYVLLPIARNGLQARRKSISERLEEAQAKQADAEARLSEYKQKLANLEREFQAVVDSYEAQARADKERIEEETDRAIDRLSRESEFTIQQEVRKAERALREAAVERTLKEAEDLVKRNLTAEDHQRLTDRYVRNLQPE